MMTSLTYMMTTLIELNERINTLGAIMIKKYKLLEKDPKLNAENPPIGDVMSSLSVSLSLLSLCLFLFCLSRSPPLPLSLPPHLSVLFFKIISHANR